MERVFWRSCQVRRDVGRQSSEDIDDVFHGGSYGWMSVTNILYLTTNMIYFTSNMTYMAAITNSMGTATNARPTSQGASIYLSTNSWQTMTNRPDKQEETY